MAISADASKRRKFKKIFYGPPGNTELFWKVKIKPATKPVRINGTLDHALSGLKGRTVGCHMSDCAMGNKSAFGHPVLMAVFTRKTCTIITKLRDGKPDEAIEYYHDYSDLVMLNDKDEFKKHIRANPHLANRTFILRPPEKIRPGRPGGVFPRAAATTGSKRSYAPRGALKRAVDAGFVDIGVAKALDQLPSNPEPNTPTLKLARRALKSMAG
jgi:hypothetical protein